MLFDELSNLLAEWGEPAYRAKQIADWIYQKRVSSFEAMTDLPEAMRKRLAETFVFASPTIVRVLGSRDTTRKFLLRLGDGNFIEAVLILVVIRQCAVDLSQR